MKSPSSIPQLKARGKRGTAQALAALENAAPSDEIMRLLDSAYAGPTGHVLGLTGPPGVGKSTLIDALIRRWRADGLTVGVIAVDPSSGRSGGALLGDRIRMMTDPEDDGVFVRSLAARGRLGGLAEHAYPAVVLMRALYDRVLVETVGVGQSEAEIAGVADTVALCIQPGSGDSLQFMKAGIMEVPDIAVVTKADMGAVADRALADLKGALSLNAQEPGASGSDGGPITALALSAVSGAGLDAFLEAVQEHGAWLAGAGRMAAQRHAQARAWLNEAVRAEWGRAGLALAADSLTLAPGESPFALRRALAGRFTLRLEPPASVGR